MQRVKSRAVGRQQGLSPGLLQGSCTRSGGVWGRRSQFCGVSHTSPPWAWVSSPVQGGVREVLWDEKQDAGLGDCGFASLRRPLDGGSLCCRRLFHLPLLSRCSSAQSRCQHSRAGCARGADPRGGTLIPTMGHTDGISHPQVQQCPYGRAVPAAQPLPQLPLQERRHLHPPAAWQHRRLHLCLPPGLHRRAVPHTPGQRLPQQPLPQRGHL